MSLLAAVLVAAISLQITVWPDGPTKEKHTYTLRCAPAAWTLPKRTQLYGGPAEAVVTGRLRGYSVSARFSRKDGCEVARWNRVGFLFPGVGTSQSGS
jgi:hypothetical protein